jgi:Tripartite tricarboxylate transporter family receptor
VNNFVPGYEANAWFGICAPGNTPTRIIEKLNMATAEVPHRCGLAAVSIPEHRNGRPSASQRPRANAGFFLEGHPMYRPTTCCDHSSEDAHDLRTTASSTLH